jgi:hypothetical protein
MKHFHRKNGTIRNMMSKKNDIIKAIPTMSYDDLFSFHNFLTNVLSACSNEMRNRKKDEDNT